MNKNAIVMFSAIVFRSSVIRGVVEISALNNIILLKVELGS